MRDRVRHYFVDLYDDATPSFVLAKKIKNYAEHQESGEWASTDSDYPEVIVVCTSIAGEKRLRKKLLQTATDSLTVFTSVIDTLENDTENTPFTGV